MTTETTDETIQVTNETNEPQARMVFGLAKKSRTVTLATKGDRAIFLYTRGSEHIKTVMDKSEMLDDIARLARHDDDDSLHLSGIGLTLVVNIGPQGDDQAFIATLVNAKEKVLASLALPLDYMISRMSD